MSGAADSGAGGMFALVDGLADQLTGSHDLRGLAGLAPLRSPPSQVLLCGMGGSAIAGDLIQPLLASMTCRLLVHRDYDLPPGIDRDTLVVASSYSGNTEETLSAVAAARRRGCRLIGLTSGGELGDLGRRQDFPVVELPGGLPPCASLGHGLGGLLWALHRLGLTPSPRQDIAAAAAVLREGQDLCGAHLSAPENVCAQLAQACLQRFPVVYTTSPETHAVGLRWKAQLNENAKSPAYCVPFPELNHNDLVGWRLDVQRRHDYVLLILRSQDEHARTARRVAITRDLLRDEFHLIAEVPSRGDRPLARLFSLIQFGDYLTCHLAAASGVDPLPVARIEILKKRLQEEGDPC